MLPEIERVKVTILPDGRLNARNAALYLGLSEKTLAMMRVQGDGPPFVKRGRIFYFQDALDKWIVEAGELRSTAQIKTSSRGGRE